MARKRNIQTLFGIDPVPVKGGQYVVTDTRKRPKKRLDLLSFWNKRNIAIRQKKDPPKDVPVKKSKKEYWKPKVTKVAKAKEGKKYKNLPINEAAYKQLYKDFITDPKRGEYEEDVYISEKLKDIVLTKEEAEKILNQVKKDFLEGDLQLKLPPAKQLLSIVTYTGENFNIKPIQKNVAPAKDTLTDKVNSLKRLRGNNKDLRPQFTYVYADDEKNALVATDSHVLGIIPHQVNDKAYYKPGKSATKEDLGKKFPEYPKVIPRQTTTTAKNLDLQTLYNRVYAVKRAMSFTDAKTYHYDVVKIAFGKEVTAANIELMEVLLEALLKNDVKTINIHYTGKKTGLVIEDIKNSGKGGMIMPAIVEGFQTANIFPYTFNFTPAKGEETQIGKYLDSVLSTNDKTETGKTKNDKSKPTRQAKPKPKAETKEPWQMTREEWKQKIDSLQSDTVQSKPTKGEGLRAKIEIDELMYLLYGVNDKAQEKLKKAKEKKINLSSEEANELLDQINTPVKHRQVIEKALKENKPVSPEVLKDYPELLIGKNSSKTKITDFGEKIGGARKDMFAEYMKTLEKLSDDAVLKKGLSALPEPDYKALVENHGVSQEQAVFLKLIRNNVGKKPVGIERAKKWVTKYVNPYKETIEQFINNTKEENQTFIENYYKKRNLVSFRESDQLKKDIQVWLALDFPFSGLEPKKYKVIKLYGDDTYRIVKGNIIVKSEPTFEKIIEQLKIILENDSNQPKRTKLGLFKDLNTKKIFIGKKLGRGKVLRVKEGFATASEAREHYKNNYNDLIKEFERLKKIPDLRPKDYGRRVGPNYRNGKDISPSGFQEKFNFKGVEFGNWVPQAEREQFLNEAYDALMDLSNIIQIPPAYLSLGGTLSMGFGSRGVAGSGANAHYEPNRAVISITRKKGAGSLAHEWFHALDNYFSIKKGDIFDYLTERPFAETRKGTNEEKLRTELIEAFKNLVKTFNLTGLKVRSKKLDERRTKNYYSLTVEMAARAFEFYIHEKLAEKNYYNGFLVAFYDLSLFEEPGSYPYPTKEEKPAIDEAYKNLFDTIDFKETNGEKELYGIPPPKNKTTYVGDTLNDTISDLKKTIFNVLPQVEELAKKLKGKNRKESAYNVWKYIRDKIKYKKDSNGLQKIKEPSVLLNDKQGDCKSMAVLAAALLRAMGYDTYLRIAEIKQGKKYTGHTYAVVNGALFETIVDPVMHKFNREVLNINDSEMIKV